MDVGKGKPVVTFVKLIVYDIVSKDRLIFRNLRPN